MPRPTRPPGPPTQEKGYAVPFLLTCVAVAILALTVAVEVYYESGVLPVIDGGETQACASPPGGGVFGGGCRQESVVRLDLVPPWLGVLLGWSALAGWGAAALAWGARLRDDETMTRASRPGPSLRRVAALVAVSLVAIDASAVGWAFARRTEFSAAELPLALLYRLGPYAALAAALVWRWRRGVTA